MKFELNNSDDEVGLEYTIDGRKVELVFPKQTEPTTFRPYIYWSSPLEFGTKQLTPDAILDRMSWLRGDKQ